MPKSLLEARGLITADYQNYLEKEWLSGLRKISGIGESGCVFNHKINT